MFRLFCLMVALQFAASSVFAQADPPAVPAAAAAGKRYAPAPSFASSLLLIEADWSKSPSAREIAAELRNLLSNEPVSADRLQALPSSGASILFPPETASIYTREHYAALLAWLKLKGLLLETEPFSIGQFEAHTPLADGQTTRFSYQANTLDKTLDFLGLTLPVATVDQPLATRRIALAWSIQNSFIADGSQPSPRLDFTRTLRTSEKPRGEERYIDRGLNDQCTFHRQRMESGEVLIVQAFPSSDDRVFRLAAAQKGFLALIAIEGDFPGSAPGPDARLLLPDKVERLPVHKVKSAGSELMIDQRNPPTSSRFMISKEVMISWSEAKDIARGFSTSLGRWAEQKIDPPATDTLAGVSEDTAVWRVGNTYYAFSGETALWDVLRLPNEHSPSDATFESGFVRVHDGDDVYTFATATGKWSSPKDGESVATSKPDAVIKVFTLRNTQAIDAERLIRQLFPRDIQSVAADQRTNSLIVRGTEEILTIIYHILTRLDEPSESAPSAPAARAARQQEASTASVEKLTTQYQSEERKAADLARQIRELQPAPEAHKQAIDELTPKLRRAVADAFAARQQLQQAEAAQLQQRIAGIQQNLQTRQKLSDTIIENRVKDLLNPDLQWEWGSDGAPRLGGQASRLPSSPVPTASPAPGSDAQVPMWVKVPANLPAARAYRDTLGTRFNQVNELFLAGRVPSSEVLQAATEYAQAELDAGANAEERWAARRQAVDRFQAIKLNIDSKFEQGTEPSQNKLAVDAALIKAESELAAESQTKRSLEPVPVHWTSRQTAQVIWNVLGVRAQEIAPQSVAKFGYRGGLLVDEVRTEPEPSLLREGDIILGLHHWETKSADELAWVIMQPIAKNVAILNPRDRTSTETAVIRILRDGQPLRFEIQLPPPRVDFNRFNWPRGSEPKSADTNSLPATTGTASSPAPASTIQLGAQADTATIRTPDDFRRRLANAAAGVERVKEIDKRGRQNQSEQWRAESLQAIQRAERDLAFLREEYAAQLRLLELELKDAQSALAFADQRRDGMQREFKAGTATRDNLLATERAIQENQTRLQRAKTLLDLYRKANSQPAAAETDPTPAADKK